MEPVWSSETSVSYHSTSRSHDTEDSDLNLHRRENHKCRISASSMTDLSSWCNCKKKNAFYIKSTRNWNPHRRPVTGTVHWFLHSDLRFWNVFLLQENFLSPLWQLQRAYKKPESFKHLQQKPGFGIIKHYTTKTCVGMQVWLHAFVTSTLDGGEWSFSRSCRFTPG